MILLWYTTIDSSNTQNPGKGKQLFVLWPKSVSFINYIIFCVCAYQVRRVSYCERWDHLKTEMRGISHTGHITTTSPQLIIVQSSSRQINYWEKKMTQLPNLIFLQFSRESSPSWNRRLGFFHTHGSNQRPRFLTLKARDQQTLMILKFHLNGVRIGLRNRSAATILAATSRFLKFPQHSNLKPYSTIESPLTYPNC